MAWSLISSTAAGSNVGVAATTPAITTIGATLVIVAVANLASAAQAVVTDNQGNTYTALTRRPSASGAVQIFYCAGPVTNASHTFTAGAQASFGQSICVAVFGGTKTSSVFDAENGSNTTSDPGAVTSTQVGELLIAAGQTAANVSSFSSITGGVGALIQFVTVSGGNHFSLGLAYAYIVNSGLTAHIVLTSSTTPSSATASFLIPPAGVGTGAGGYAFA